MSHKPQAATLLNYWIKKLSGLTYLRTLAACLWPLAPRRDARSAKQFDMIFVNPTLSFVTPFG